MSFFISCGLLGDFATFREWLNNLSPMGWTLFAGAVFGFGGMVTTFVVSMLLFGSVSFRGVLFLGLLFAPGVGIGGFTIGGCLWGVIVEARRKYSNGYGSLVGALVGLLAHFALALFFFVSGGVPDTRSVFIDEFVRRVLISGAFTSVVAGIFTVPAGAFIGWQLARLRRSGLESDASSQTEEPGIE